jgi:peptidoglycan/xylan/chitin deacetylase (PgdA/CDA1 family)
MPVSRRFACLTFDGGHKDVIAQAYPILSRHRVPFTVYLPTAFPDGLGEAWWLALEEIIARESRISLVIDRKEHHYTVRGGRRNTSCTNFSRAGCVR